MKRLNFLLLVVTVILLSAVRSGAQPPSDEVGTQAGRRYLFPDVNNGSCRAVVVPTTQAAIHTAQILPLDQDGAIVGKGDSLLQIKQVFANLAKVLASADSGLQEIVKLNVYVRDPDVSAKVQKWLSVTYSGKGKPAVSYVATRLPHADARVAVDAVALARKVGKSVVQFWHGGEIRSFVDDVLWRAAGGRSRLRFWSSQERGRHSGRCHPENSGRISAIAEVLRLGAGSDCAAEGFLLADDGSGGGRKSSVEIF